MGFIVERGHGRPVHVVGHDVIIKISSRDAGGLFAVFEGRTRPFKSATASSQQQDESWYIVEGEYRFEVDGHEIYARAGDTVFALRGTGTRLRTLERRSAARLLRRSRRPRSLFETVAPPGTVPDPTKMLPNFEKLGLELHGPPALRPSSHAD